MGQSAALSAIYWDPNPEMVRLPFIDWPVLWYGFFFALGFGLGFPLFVSILTRFLGKGEKEKAVQIGDRLTLYLILGTLIGARLGHFLFYEPPSYYLANPLEILRIWEGGLASHGAAFGIGAALFLFSRRIRQADPRLTWIRLLDFVSIPAAFAGGCIRIGNFINQEILGTESHLPWAVIFGHPADQSLPAPRHPVQLYEAVFYFSVFLVLWRLSYHPFFLKTPGKLIGIFLISVFGFRFCIESIKLEQSHLFCSPLFTMGQILSIPPLIFGLVCYFRRRPFSS